MIRVGSIIEILNYSVEGDSGLYSKRYPPGSRWPVLRFHQDTGEVEICCYSDRVTPENDLYWHTFFPGEYKLVE